MLPAHLREASERLRRGEELRRRSTQQPAAAAPQQFGSQPVPAGAAGGRWPRHDAPTNSTEAGSEASQRRRAGGGGSTARAGGRAFILQLERNEWTPLGGALRVSASDLVSLGAEIGRQLGLADVRYQVRRPSQPFKAAATGSG
eukprot:COSAG02_NODE_7345_length_3053_cov_9.087339_4_plen_144_part_00